MLKFRMEILFALVTPKKKRNSNNAIYPSRRVE